MGVMHRVFMICLALAALAVVTVVCGCGGGGRQIQKQVGQISTSEISSGRSICSGKAPDFSVLVAVGASYTAGMQNFCLHEPMEQNGPMAQAARQLGASLPLPIFAEEGNVECWRVQDDGSIYDPLVLPMGLTRLNSSTQNYNIAIPGETVGQFLRDTAYKTVMHLLILDPNGTLGYSVSQADVMEALHPTFIMSTDLAGNNLLDYEEWDEYKDDYREAIRRMSETGADFFVANQPDITKLPGWDEYYSPEIVSYYQNMVQETNKEIKKVVEDEYGGHVVDLFSAMREWDSGVSVSGVTLDFEFGNGIFSLDALHLTSVGYALIANEFIKKINTVYDCRYPEIDIAQVLATEPYSPKTIKCNNSLDVDDITCEKLSP